MSFNGKMPKVILIFAKSFKFEFLTPQLVLNLLAGVKLSDASKKLGKKFATGASVVKVRFTCL